MTKRKAKADEPARSPEAKAAKEREHYEQSIRETRRLLHANISHMAAAVCRLSHNLATRSRLSHDKGVHGDNTDHVKMLQGLHSAARSIMRVQAIYDRLDPPGEQSTPSVDGPDASASTEGAAQ